MKVEKEIIGNFDEGGSKAACTREDNPRRFYGLFRRAVLWRKVKKVPGSNCLRTRKLDASMCLQRGYATKTERSIYPPHDVGRP